MWYLKNVAKKYSVEIQLDTVHKSEINLKTATLSKVIVLFFIYIYHTY